MGYVYKITNNRNNKSYIGISIHEPEKGRIKDHLSGRGNQLLANAIEKYGKEAFTYEILEANVFDEFLPELEVAYIANLNTVAPHGYNLTSGGEISKTYSEVTRRKISEALSGEKNPNFGKRHSVSTRRKISEAHKGEKNHQFGKPLSEVTRRKISEALSGEKNPNFGKRHSVSTRRKISEAHKGKKLSTESIRKRSEARRGKPLSEVTRRKISEANRGRKYSAETLRKMAESNRHPEYAETHKFFRSLPLDMPLSEKRNLLSNKFSNVSKTSINRWTRKWMSSCN